MIYLKNLEIKTEINFVLKMIFICLYELYCATYPNTKVNKNLEKNLLILSTKYCCVYYIFFCSYATIADLQQAFFVDFSHPLTTCSLGSSSRFPEIRSKLPCHTSVMYGLLKYILKKPLVMVRTSIIMHRYFKWK